MTQHKGMWEAVGGYEPVGAAEDLIFTMSVAFVGTWISVEYSFLFEQSFD
jgi:hypothetical protein